MPEAKAWRLQGPRPQLPICLSSCAAPACDGSCAFWSQRLLIVISTGKRVLTLLLAFHVGRIPAASARAANWAPALHKARRVSSSYFTPPPVLLPIPISRTSPLLYNNRRAIATVTPP